MLTWNRRSASENERGKCSCAEEKSARAMLNLHKLFDFGKDDKMRCFMLVATSQLTGLLEDWKHGDPTALQKLTPLIYDELRRIAHRYAQRERNGHTLETTALVNEAYLRLAGEKRDWQNRSHFFAVTAQVMRHILIDHARRRHYVKHGGEAQHVPIEAASVMASERAAELIALDEALEEFARLDPRKARVVELRYFGGLSLEETAEAVGLSLMTVRRDWQAAKAWLYRRLKHDS